MADIYLTTATGDTGRAYRRLRDSAHADQTRQHRLTEDPAHADVILFVATRDVGPSLRNVRHHPLYHEHRERCYAYSEYDFIVPLVPGIYPSVNRAWNLGGRARGGPYVSWYAQDDALEPAPDTSPAHLFSFTGAARHANVRKVLLRLDHPDAFVKDTSRWYTARDRSTEAAAAYRAQYLDSIRGSHFVLCPRGLGASSVRLFDVMRMGRVPVILSDAWLPPEGPDWDAFSIRVPERDALTLPAVLEARIGDAARMGRLARLAWERWFHPDVLFHRFAEACLSIARSRTLIEPVARPLAAAQFILHPPTVKTCLWRMMHGKRERRFAT